MCDRCSSWSHSACYELSAEAAKANAFTCFFCSPSLLSCVLAAKFPHLSSRAVPLSVFGELVSKVSQLEDHLHHELRSSRLVMAVMQNQVERQSRLAPPVRPIPPHPSLVCGPDPPGPWVLLMLGPPGIAHLFVLSGVSR